MKSFVTLTLVLLHLSLFSIAQSEERIEIKSMDRQLIRRNDTIYRFYAVFPEDPIPTRPDRTYYWYKSDTILTTVGGYDGRILDGSYVVFYPDKNLEEEGVFRYGLRNGEWRVWYPGGKLRNITHWEDGIRKGLFIDYDYTGRILREGVYKNDLLEGKVKEYALDGSIHAIVYKKGIPRTHPAREGKK